jgi:polyvinyl alcohol dehydrogenase (cytochrome)
LGTRYFAWLALLACCPLSTSFAQTPAPVESHGESLFKAACAACHVQPPPFVFPGAPAPVKSPPAVPAAAPVQSADAKAPTRDVLRQLTPEALLSALTNGKMQPQGAALSDADRRAIAEAVTNKTLLASIPVTKQNLCAAPPPLRNGRGPSWNGWGNGVTNTRFQPREQGGLSAADLPGLKLKWAFGYAGVASARTQPAYVGGRLFVASENGDVLALDPKTGCTIWTFRAQTGVRTALTVGPYTDSTGKNGSAVYFGDSRANAYGVDAQSGRQIWTRKIDEHRVAGITGALTVSQGRVFVPLQGVGEETMGGMTPGYECCTFRGSLSALDASTGAVLWKTYTVGEGKPRGKSKEGAQLYGPAGGSIWSASTVDTKRGLVYVGTGNGFADPPQATTDAVLALDVRSGAIKWAQQVLPGDNWSMGCPEKNTDKLSCPKELGPDYDFSAAPALVKVKGRDLLVIPQKSGMAYALDPAKKGEVVWRFRYGQGSAMGGQWGGAVDRKQAYFGVADLLTPTPGGMRAVNLANGKLAWAMPPQPKLCKEGFSCRAGQGGALTAIPGAVISGGADGGLRAYSSKDGTIIWLFDTNRDFETVNGVKARGGGMDGSSIIVADGMLYVSSGAGGMVGAAGNVLLAFSIN